MGKILITFVALIVALLAIVPAANYAGICINEGGFISEESRKESAIRYAMSQMGSYVVIKNGRRNEIEVPEDFDKYSSVIDFIKFNPECCHVRGRGIDGYTPGLYQRLIGRYRSTVTVDYQIRYKFHDVWRLEKQSRDIAVTNCGDAWSGNLR